MKASQITIDCPEQTIETPGIVHRIIREQRDLDLFIQDFGDVEIQPHDWAGRPHWIVPEFAEAIRRDSEACQKECDRWGCE